MDAHRHPTSAAARGPIGCRLLILLGTGATLPKVAVADALTSSRCPSGCFLPLETPQRTQLGRRVTIPSDVVSLLQASNHDLATLQPTSEHEAESREAQHDGSGHLPSDLTGLLSSQSEHGAGLYHAGAGFQSGTEEPLALRLQALRWVLDLLAPHLGQQQPQPVPHLTADAVAEALNGVLSPVASAAMTALRGAVTQTAAPPQGQMVETQDSSAGKGQLGTSPLAAVLQATLARQAVPADGAAPPPVSVPLTTVLQSVLAAGAEAAAAPVHEGTEAMHKSVPLAAVLQSMLSPGTEGTTGTAATAAQLAHDGTEAEGHGTQVNLPDSSTNATESSSKVAVAQPDEPLHHRLEVLRQLMTLLMSPQHNDLLRRLEEEIKLKADSEGKADMGEAKLEASPAAQAPSAPEPQAAVPELPASVPQQMPAALSPTPQTGTEFPEEQRTRLPVPPAAAAPTSSVEQPVAAAPQAVPVAPLPVPSTVVGVHPALSNTATNSDSSQALAQNVQETAAEEPVAEHLPSPHSAAVAVQSTLASPAADAAGTVPLQMPATSSAALPAQAVLPSSSTLLSPAAEAASSAMPPQMPAGSSAALAAQAVVPSSSVALVQPPQAAASPPLAAPQLQAAPPAVAAPYVAAPSMPGPTLAVQVQASAPPTESLPQQVLAQQPAPQQVAPQQAALQQAAPQQSALQQLVVPPQVLPQQAAPQQPTSQQVVVSQQLLAPQQPAPQQQAIAPQPLPATGSQQVQAVQPMPQAQQQPQAAQSQAAAGYVLASPPAGQPTGQPAGQPAYALQVEPAVSGLAPVAQPAAQPAVQAAMQAAAQPAAQPAAAPLAEGHAPAFSPGVAQQAQVIQPPPATGGEPALGSLTSAPVEAHVAFAPAALEPQVLPVGGVAQLPVAQQPNQSPVVLTAPSAVTSQVPQLPAETHAPAVPAVLEPSPLSPVAAQAPTVQQLAPAVMVPQAPYVPSQAPLLSMEPYAHPAPAVAEPFPSAAQASAPVAAEPPTRLAPPSLDSPVAPVRAEVGAELNAGASHGLVAPGRPEEAGVLHTVQQQSVGPAAEPEMVPSSGAVPAAPAVPGQAPQQAAAGAAVLQAVSPQQVAASQAASMPMSQAEGGTTVQAAGQPVVAQGAGAGALPMQPPLSQQGVFSAPVPSYLPTAAQPPGQPVASPMASATVMAATRTQEAWGTEQETEKISINATTKNGTTVTLDVVSPNVIVSVYLLMYVPITMGWMALWQYGSQEAHYMIMLPVTLCTLIVGLDLINQSLSIVMDSPMAITAIQGVALAVITAVWTITSEWQRPSIEGSMMWPLSMWAVVAIMFTLFQLINHQVSYWCSLSERTVFTNLCPVLSMFVELTLNFKVTVTFWSKMALSTMVLGAILYSIQYPDFTPSGVLFACLMVAVIIPYRLLQRWLLVKCVTLPLPLLAFADGVFLIAPSSIISATQQTHFWSAWSSWFSHPSICLMLLLSLVTFTANHICSLMMLRRGSATNYLVFHNLANFLVVTMGILFFGDDISSSPLELTGLIISLVGGLWYAVEVQRKHVPTKADRALHIKAQGQEQVLVAEEEGPALNPETFPEEDSCEPWEGRSRASSSRKAQAWA